MNIPDKIIGILANENEQETEQMLRAALRDGYEDVVVFKLPNTFTTPYVGEFEIVEVSTIENARQYLNERYDTRCLYSILEPEEQFIEFKEYKQKKARPTKIAVIVSIFDPTCSSVLWVNYHKFREALDNRVDVFVAEVSFTGEFHIQDAAVHIHANQRQILWQKERLFNLLLDQLPSDYDAVMWTDADIIFDNPNWLDETLDRLQFFDIVFPYSEVTRLDAIGGAERKQRAAPLVDRYGFSSDSPHWHRDKAQGLCWAFRREWINQHRFADIVINGAGDAHEYFAIMGDHTWGQNHCTPSVYEQWLIRSEQMQGTNISYIDGHVTHLYHGSKNNRQYKALELLLKEIEFDPSRDIKKSDNGLWEWTGDESAYQVIQESFRKRQMDDVGNGRRYSEFLRDGSTQPTWDSSLGKTIMSRHAGKAFVRGLKRKSLRFPLTYNLKSRSVIKPDQDSREQRVQVIEDSDEWICEEYLPHDKDYRLYAFAGRVVMLQIETCRETPGCMHKTGYVYKKYPEWKTIEIDQVLIDRPDLQIEAEKPKCLIPMISASEEISFQFPVPVRVDFFVNEKGAPVFSKMSITPGLVKDGRIADAGDLWLGNQISEPQINLRQAHEPQDGPIPLPDDTGVLTSTDRSFFPAFQLLFVSVLARYKTQFAVVDLGMTTRQKKWCGLQSEITIITLPQKLPVSRDTDAWQSWNKPLYFQLSPFKRNLWIDSDCVVMGGLEEMSTILQDRFYTCECIGEYRREDRFTFPHKLFGTEPVNDALVMAGICGFDRSRDREFINDWLQKCIELEKAPQSQRVMQDQEALQWMIDTNGFTDRILRGESWNQCNVRYDGSGPREFLDSLPKDGANIYHFYGKSRGSPPFWSGWGDIPIWGNIPQEVVKLIDPIGDPGEIHEGDRPVYSADVIIPYCEAYIPFVPDAVRSILNQVSAKPIIHLISDGIPVEDDAIYKEFSKYENIRTYFNEQSGPYIATNRVFQYLETDYMVIMDADDISMPNRIWQSVNSLEVSGADIYGGSMEQFVDHRYANQRTLTRIKREPIIKSINNEYIIHGASTSRKVTFEKLNGYGDFFCGADWHYIYRGRRSGCQFYYSDNIIAIRRLHSASLTTTDLHGSLSVFRKAILDEMEEHYKQIRKGADVRQFGSLAKYRDSKQITKTN